MANALIAAAPLKALERSGAAAGKAVWCCLSSAEQGQMCAMQVMMRQQETHGASEVIHTLQAQLQLIPVHALCLQTPGNQLQRKWSALLCSEGPLPRLLLLPAACKLADLRWCNQYLNALGWKLLYS
jgi:hypothetical protein